MPKIDFFTAAHLQNLPWPQHADGRYARSVLGALLTHGTQAFFDNVSAEVQAICCEDLVLPLVLARAGQNNAYVCSPLGHYVHYAREELEIEMQRWPALKKLLEKALYVLGGVLEALQLEEVAYANNWLLSTNLYPAFDLSHLHAIREALIQRFPQRAVIFRSVNLKLNRSIFEALCALGFYPVLSRQVYILDPASGQHRSKNPYKEDRRLAKKTLYRWESAAQIQPQDIPRLRWLYDDLYLRKYSYLNPQFNELFLRRSLSEQWLTYYVLRDQNNRIDAMVGYVERNGVFTTPLVGYDTSLPKSLGLYRLITYQLIQEAEQKGWILNHSSGVARFKTLRGCVPSMEYNLVYTAHLPRIRQAPWRLLQGISKTFLEPMMQQLQL